MNRHRFLRAIGAKPLRTIFWGAVLGAVLGLLAPSLLPPRTDVSLSFTIAEQARQETSNYSYDGYYALRASDLVADTMISWLSTPSVIKEIYADAKLEISDAQAVAEAGRAFRAKKFSSQNVVVTFSTTRESDARKLAAATADVLTRRAGALLLSPKEASLFIVTPSAPVVSASALPPRAAIVAGLLLGAFLGFALAYVLRENAD